MTAEGGRKKIFISHAADDPDWPELAVEAVAEKLRSRGAEVWLDVWHEAHLRQKLPLSEWRQWMRGCLDRADHVLCLCSPRYAVLARREDLAEPVGRGVAFEAFEIEKRLYHQKQHNRNWVWLLEVQASGPVVPTFLEDRCPEYVTPAEDDRLVNDLAGQGAGQLHPSSAGRGEGPCPGESEPGSTRVGQRSNLSAQRRLVRERLESCPEILQALRDDDWQGAAPSVADFATPASFADWLAALPASQARTAMKAARRVLNRRFPAEEVRRRAELAAVSVYLLAACNLVSADKLEAARRFPRSVRDQAHLYCAVISTVLAGGHLDLVPSGQEARPSVRHAYEIRVPAAGDNRQAVFERAVLQALFSTRPGITTASLDDDPLSSLDVARLQERLETIREIDRSALTLVVHVDALYPPADAFAQRYDVPVFVCSDEVAEVLVGMTVERLVADIEGLWRQLTHCNRSVDSSLDTPPDPSRETSMNSSTRHPAVNITVSGGSTASVAVSNGVSSLATSGAVSHCVSQNVLQQWRQIDDVLSNLPDMLAQVQSTRGRNSLEPVIEQVLGESRAEPKPDSPKRLAGFLNDLKRIGDAVDGAEKIVEVCGKALALVLPMITGA